MLLIQLFFDFFSMSAPFFYIVCIDKFIIHNIVNVICLQLSLKKIIKL